MLGSAVAATLDDVRKVGYIQCGVSEGVSEFSNPDSESRWAGIDVDVCRVVAAAIFADADKVKYSPLSVQDGFAALRAGQVDILSRNIAWTLAGDTATGMNFAGVNFSDGHGFVLRKALGITSAKELVGASGCSDKHSGAAGKVADYFRRNQMASKAVEFETMGEVLTAYDAGRCDAYTAHRSASVGQGLSLRNPDAHVILPDVISKRPLGPLVRHGDDQWLDLVKWTLYAMLEAEEVEITSANVDGIKAKSTNPEVKRLLGVEGDLGKNLGVSPGWAYNIIKLVGNYAEVFEKHLGPKTAIGLARGINALWTKGGIQYAMPVR